MKSTPFLALSGVFILSASAFASGDGGGGGGLLSPNPGLAIWTLLTFLIVLGVLWVFAWKPLMESLDNRTNYIENMIKEADEKHRKAEEILKKYEEKLENAKAEAVGIIEEGKKDALELRKRIGEQASKEAENLKKSAQKEIELATKQAKEEIWKTAVEISTSLAEKIMSRALSSKDDQKIIEDVLGEYEKN